MDFLEDLKSYFDDKGMSQVDIAEKLGVSKAYVNALLSGRSAFGKKQAEIWENNFGLSKTWLLTGEGEMLKSDTAQSGKDGQDEGKDDDRVCLLPVEAMAGPLQDFSMGVELGHCRKIKSPVKGADWAIQISGSSMEPYLRSGMIIYIRKISGRFIPWGEVMVMDTYDGVVVKEIYPVEDDPEVVEARSTNPKFPPFRIEKSLIIGIYRVLGGSFINSTI